ncbi:MAG: hypothetical protein ACRD0A_10475, partial [Acidimicrobiales bacterium]
RKWYDETDADRDGKYTAHLFVIAYREGGANPTFGDRLNAGTLIVADPSDLFLIAPKPTRGCRGCERADCELSAHVGRKVGCLACRWAVCFDCQDRAARFLLSHPDGQLCVEVDEIVTKLIGDDNKGYGLHAVSDAIHRVKRRCEETGSYLRYPSDVRKALYNELAIL